MEESPSFWVSEKRLSTGRYFPRLILLETIVSLRSLPSIWLLLLKASVLPKILNCMEGFMPLTLQQLIFVCPYSPTYINAAYDFSVGDIILTPSIGFTPHESLYSNGKDATITDISVKASKELKVTDSFSLPVFVQAIVAPAYDKTFLTFGVSF